MSRPEVPGPGYTDGVAVCEVQPQVLCVEGDFWSRGVEGWSAWRSGLRNVPDGLEGGPHRGWCSRRCRLASEEGRDKGDVTGWTPTA